MDLKCFDEISADDDASEEQQEVDPIGGAQLEFEDFLGNEILCEGGEKLHAEAGAGGTYGIEPRDDEEIQQDIDDHPGGGYEIKLFEAPVGREQRAKDVGRGKAEEASHQNGEDPCVLPDA